MKKEEQISKDLLEFRNKYPAVTSADLQTFVIGWNACYDNYISIPAVERHWVCNECNFPNFTTSVSEEEIEAELYACINCGGFEFHLEPKNKES